MFKQEPAVAAQQQISDHTASNGERPSAASCHSSEMTSWDDDLPGEVTIIEPPAPWIRLNLGEVWTYRDLLFLLIWRDLAARYRQSVVGYGWAVIKPVVSMLIFTFVFGSVAGIKSDGSPYPLMIFTAILPWMYFSGALQTITNSVVSSGAFLNKVYFPRLVLPLVGVVTGLMELAIQLAVLVVLLIYYQLAPGWQLLFAPLFIVIAAATALAVGLWLTALNVKYRDVGQALPFLIQTWMWLCPIVYSSHSVPAHLRLIYGLNPMVGVIEGFRWSWLGGAEPDWRMMSVSLIVVAGLLVGGLYYFRKTEDTFADII
jgi:lipopolysaccharide transport system permease protein